MQMAVQQARRASDVVGRLRRMVERPGIALGRWLLAARPLRRAPRAQTGTTPRQARACAWTLPLAPPPRPAPSSAGGNTNVSSENPVFCL